MRGSHFRHACLAVSLVALAHSDMASAADTPPPPADADAFTLDEIVVTARRKFESLQDVPLVVEALTAETLDKMNVTNLADIQKVVPGLNMTQSINCLSHTVRNLRTSVSTSPALFPANTTSPRSMTA